MQSYQAWFGEGPEQFAVFSGYFDRAVDEKALGALMKQPAVRELIESFNRFETNRVANNYGANEPMLGRKAIGDSIITIERLRPSRQRLSGRWSHFSWQ
jgi:hypothetical protein